MLVLGQAVHPHLRVAETPSCRISKREQRMRTPVPKIRLRGLILSAAILSAVLGPRAQAGDVYLTGHDVLLHSGQNGYDAVIINFLRGATPAGTYNIGVVGTANTGFAAFTGGPDITGNHNTAIPLAGTLAGYGSATFYDATALAADPTRATILAGLDLLIIESHTSCGGCSLTTAGSTALNTMAADIAAAFNAGMDIWGQSGASLATYYDFLPAGAVATGASISGSTGFSATAAGSAIGIASNMINGFPTHNRFTSQAPAFTVFETRVVTGGTEVISIGLQGGAIDGGGITVPGAGVPDSGSTALLLGLALTCCEALRRAFRIGLPVG